MELVFYDNAIQPEVLEPDKLSRKIKAYNDEIMMVEVFFENEAIGAVHSHRHTQTTYCLDGSFEFCIGEQKIVINVGDSLYIPPDEPHGCQLLGAKGRLLDVFCPHREDFLK